MSAPLRLTEKPYREYNRALFVDALRTNMNESGADHILPSAFCLSHTERNAIMRDLYTKVCDKVKIISQRVDDMANDPVFLELTRHGGSHTVTLGIEGHSDRVRRLVNKNITEEQILHAIKNVMDAGYSRIKFFMLDNVPTETDEDLDEFLCMARKIAKLRDEHPNNCIMRWSWTCLRILDHTPFQWLKPNMVERERMYQIRKELRDMNFLTSFAAFKRDDDNYYIQLSILADSRFAPVIVGMVDDMDNSAVKGFLPGTKDYIDRKLQELYGFVVVDSWQKLQLLSQLLAAISSPIPISP